MIKRFVRPKTLAEARRVLRQGRGRWVPLAGGTWLARSCPRTVSGLVDISRLVPGEIRKERGGLAIGAMATAARIAASDLVPPMLAAAAMAEGPTQIRNRGTLGGAIALGEGPLVAALLALDARVRLAGGRVVDVTAPLAPGDIIIMVLIERATR